MIQLNNLCVAVRGVGKLNVREMQQDSTYTLLLLSIPTSTLIYPASSVFGSLRGELVTVGNSVQFSTGPNEVRHCFCLSIFLAVLNVVLCHVQCLTT